MITTLIGIFAANAFAHVISFQKLRQAKAADAPGVLVFAFINAVIAVLLWQGIGWTKWLALAVPVIGGAALFFTKIIKGHGTWIDYIILILDILAIGLCLKYFIL